MGRPLVSLRPGGGHCLTAIRSCVVWVLLMATLGHRDTEMIIYERASIEAYIKKKGNQARCPHMGTVHSVRLEELRLCTHLLDERKCR